MAVKVAAGPSSYLELDLGALIDRICVGLRRRNDQPQIRKLLQSQQWHRGG
jgi:hypothetical protein